MPSFGPGSNRPPAFNSTQDGTVIRPTVGTPSIPRTATNSPSVPSTSGMTVKNVAPVPDFMDEIRRKAAAFTPNEQALGSAMQSILPMYQARLGGLQGQTMDAMRLNAQQDIQSQYGNALRQAQQIAGNQGIRGPAAAAMQGDIRNQMGQAQAKYSRDLTVADWDAKRQALADYYGATGNMVGLSMGTPITMQQMQNSMTGMDKYGEALKQQLAAAQQRGGLQSIQQGFQATPMSSQFPLNPLAPSYYLPKMFS